MNKKSNVKKALSVLLSVCLVLAMVPFGIVGVTAAGTVEVSTLAALQSALADESVSEVIVTASITLTDGTELYGNGKTVRAQKTGVDEQGIVQTGSNYNVFKTAANATVHIYDMTIMGGSVSAIVNATGKLYLDNVTITRSGSETNAGGAIVNGVQKLQNNKNVNHKTAYVVMKNSSIVRNVAVYGGGFMNYGTLIMDGCSLTENRSINSSGGGGAGENEGYAYLNNCTVANNTSSEIGGGINVCKGGELYIMNCTFTGNVTYCNGGGNYGGAIGDNNCTVKAVNSIFANNYYINKSSQTVTPCDLGLYKGTDVTIYDSIVGSSSGGNPTLENCSNDTSGLFAAYVTGNVLAGDGTESTADFSKPAVVQNSSGELYTPLNGNYQGDIEGVPTYFDYSDLDNIRMYFTDDEGTESTFFAGSGIEPTDVPVGDALDDTDRDTTLIGSSNSLGEGKTIYTIIAKASEHGSIKGGTIYGDSYIVVSDGSVVSVEEIVTVTLEAIPDNGYYFDKWELLEGGSDNGELAQLASEIEAIQAQITTLTNAVTTTTSQKEAVEANIGDADKTPSVLFDTTNKRQLVTDTNTLVTTLNGYKTSLSAYSNVVSAITSANLATKTYNRTTKYSSWCTSAVNTATSVITLLEAHLVDARAALSAKQDEYNAAVAAANAGTGLNPGNNPMEFIVDRNISLKADFVSQAPDYTVTFHSNTEPETTATQTFAAGHYTANLTANTFDNDGQPFLGWAFARNGKVAYADGASYTANGNQDLYARWGFYVDYNANGGRNAPEKQIKNAGTDLTLAAAQPTREGFAFKGWATSADATAAEYAAGAVYTADAAVTLYAVWQELKAPEVIVDDTTETTDPETGALTVPDAVVGDAYSHTISTDQNAVFVVTDGALPNGLTLNKSTGEISGTPTTAGSYTFTISVYNAEDKTIPPTTQVVNMTVLTPEKAALKEALDAAASVNDAITGPAADALNAAEANGQSVLDDDTAGTAAITSATDAVTGALDDLLAAEITAAQDAADDGYTAETVQDLTEAIAAAQAVQANPDSTPAEVAAAINDLADAIDNLVTDKNGLQDAVDAANAIDTNGDTPDSVNDLQDAIDAAQAVLDDPDATPDDVAAAEQALQDAIDNLVTDKSGLQEAVDNANAIDETQYTPDSAADLQDAIDAAQAVLDDPDATPAEVAAAEQALQDAIDNLVTDKSGLQEAVDNANAIDETQYTPDSAADLQDAIDAAQAVLDDPDATPADVAAAEQALQDAIDNLVTDKSDLQDAVDNANAIDETQYTPDSAADLQDAIDAAQAVLDDPDATPADVAAAEQALQDAVDNLVVDKSELQAAVDAANALDKTGYTPDSVNALQDAIDAAQAVLDDPDATAADVAAAKQALQDAIDNLVTDKNELQAAVDAANDLDKTGYTPDSVNALQDAIDAAQAVLDDPDATPADVAAAKQALQDAIDNLAADKSGLQDAVDVANAIDQDLFTPESAADLQDAIDAAQAVLDDPDATPADVAAAEQALQDAVDNLVTDKSGLQDIVDDAKKIDDDGYTPESIADLQDAIDAAQDVLDDPDATPDDVAAAEQALKDAIDNLVVDKSGLQQAIETGSAIAPDGYTDASYNALQQAIADGETVYNDPDATAAQVVAATNAINDAINALENKADYTEYEQTKQDIIDEITNNPDDYPQDVIDQIQDALDNIDNTLPDDLPADDQATVDAAKDDLDDLLDTLAQNRLYDLVFTDEQGNVIATEKIKTGTAFADVTAPAMPTDANIYYAGWYNESGKLVAGTDVVTADMNLTRASEYKTLVPKDGSNVTVTEDAQTGTAYITGVPAGTTVEEALALFVNDETVLEVKKYDATELAGLDFVGTGSTATLKSKFTGEVYKTWSFIIMGDVDGDGKITSADLTTSRLVGLGDYTYPQENSYFLIANEMNGDGIVDVLDSALIKRMMTN